MSTASPADFFSDFFESGPYLTTQIMTNPGATLSSESIPDPAVEVLQRINDGFQVLADLHAAISTATGGDAPALEHVTAATRELAALQRLFDRRSDR